MNKSRLMLIAFAILAALGTFETCRAILRANWSEAAMAGFMSIATWTLLGWWLRMWYVRRTYTSFSAKVLTVQYEPEPRLTAEHQGRTLVFEGSRLDYKYPAYFVFRGDDATSQAEEPSFLAASGKPRRAEVPVLMDPKQPDDYRIDAATIHEFAYGDVSVIARPGKKADSLGVSVVWRMTPGVLFNKATGEPKISLSGGVIRELSYWRKEPGQPGEFLQGLLPGHDHAALDTSSSSGSGIGSPME
jgi:hypothetical protein